jgi:hypothetical protein
MLNKILLFLGFVWTFPVTLLGLLFHFGPFSLFGWYEFISIEDFRLVFYTTDKMPTWLANLWKHWAGHAFGALVVLNKDIVPTVLFRTIKSHEFAHVKQSFILGIFQPIIYGLAWLAIKLVGDGDPYLDNPFEIMSRRAAHQIVDIQSYKEKLAAKKQNRT